MINTLANWLVKKSEAIRYAAKTYADRCDRQRAYEDDLKEMLKDVETSRWAVRIWSVAPTTGAFCNTLYTDKGWAILIGRDIARDIADRGDRAQASDTGGERRTVSDITLPANSETTPVSDIGGEG